MKNQANRLQPQRGDIAISLTVLAVFLMTVGALIGSSLIANPALRGRITSAQTPSITANQANITASQLEMSFGPIVDRNTNQKMTAGNLCFSSVSSNPPNSGAYRLKAYLKLKGSSRAYEAGSSLDYKILTQRGAFQCPNQKPYDLFFYRNVQNVPGVPSDTTNDDIASLEIHVVTHNGDWSPNMSNPVATVGNPEGVFDKTPAGGPVSTPVPTTAPQPTECHNLPGNVPAAVSSTALSNPESVPGWNPTNNSTKLSVENPTQPWHAENNKLVYTSNCDRGAPGNGKLNLTMKVLNLNDIREGFTSFEFTPQICEVEASGATGACGSTTTLPTPSKFIVHRTNPSTTQKSDLIDIPQKKLRVLMNYGYKKSDGTINNSGVIVTHGSTTCSGERADDATFVSCDITASEGQIDLNFEARLPAVAESTPVPTTAPGDPTNTPVPTAAPTTAPEDEKTIVYVSGPVYNPDPTRTVTGLTLTVCANGVECQDDTISVNIPPRTIAFVYFTYEFETEVVTHVHIGKLRGTWGEGINTSSFEHDVNLNVTGNQDILLYLLSDETGTGLTSAVKTTTEAADVSKDGCVNANDAALLLPKLGTQETSVNSCAASDVVCDGFHNALDLSMIIDNLNQGFGCVYNQPTE